MLMSNKNVHPIFAALLDSFQTAFGGGSKTANQAVDESSSLQSETVAKSDSSTIERAHREVTTFRDGRCKHQWIGIDHMMWECALCSKVRTHD
jgi:hypothetical protein